MESSNSGGDGKSGDGVAAPPKNEDSMDGMETISLDRAPLAYFSSSDYRSAIAASAMSPSADPDDDEEIQQEQQHPLAAPSPSKADHEHRNRYSESNFGSRRGDTLLEPPSYADAIFTPYVGEGSGSGNGSMTEAGDGLHSPASSSSDASEYLNISVAHPQKVQESSGSTLVPGANMYVSYLVVTRTNIPEYGGTEFSVRRRFRDFVTLGDRLAESYRGYFIPPRPDKSIVESQVMQKQEFIEQRRVALEKYLGRLATHPVLRKSDELRVFLQTTGKLPLLPSIDMASRMLDGAAKLPKQLFGEGSTMFGPQDAVQPAKGGRDLLRLFKELRQSVTNDWGGTKPPVVEEDKEFLDKKDKLQDLEQELTEASQQAEALVKAQQEVGEVMGELGLALIRVAKFETEEAAGNAQRVHAADAKRLATAAVKASRFYREANAQSVKHLDHLHEYLGLMQAVHAAFSDRSSALLTLQTLMTDLSAMHGRIEKLNVASSKVFGGDRTKNRKIEELNESIRIAEQSRDCAQKEYERIKERNRTEIEQYEANKERDFFEMLKGFVHTQVAYAEKIANVWSKTVEEANGNVASMSGSAAVS